VNEGRYLKFLYRKEQEDGIKIGTKALAEAFGVRPATVTGMLQKLSEKGLLEYKRYYGADLTEKGLIEAEKLLRKHRILEVLFVRLLDYSSQKACDEAAELDQCVSESLANAICRVNGHTEVCPCGKPIYKNKTCCGG
jgi:DtxR family Mn-dependent transcriptional regulator